MRVKLGVITPVDEPTHWISSVAYAWKMSGELCICLDPHNLNNAICSNHHYTPTLDKVAHEFAHSKYFTKLDARHGYWAVILHSKSSLLTTFNTLYIQYCFLCLPFGLACSQDVFQKRIDQILEECEGCIVIADDVHGHMEAEHDACLWKLMEVAWKYGLLFNPKKTQVKAPMVKFFGCCYDESGVHPDPEKIDAVHALPTPTNITELQEFLGMATYLSPFIPGFSTLTAPLCELLKKDAEFSWDASYQRAFQCFKNAVVSDTTLQYFDASFPITVQVDGWQVRLGATLLQDNKPVIFASRALTEVECCYANIEHEMLAVVFGAEWFKNYVYGRPYTFESDHKPLESITKKNLTDTPAWLQCMLLHLQGYDYILCYCPGKEMALPDTLSHIMPKPGPEIALDIAIHHAILSSVWKEALQLAFEMDVEIHAIADINISGWPNNIKKVQHPLLSLLAAPWVTHCWRWTCVLWRNPHHPSIRKGEGPWYSAPITPSISKTQLLAHGCVFWPCINKAIEEAVWQCETCMRFQAQNAATPLTPTPITSHPWQICASDIFTLDGMDYPILADFYSKVILVHNLSPQGKVALPKSSTSWKKGVVIMANQKSYAQIMAHSMLVLPLQIVALNGVSPVKPPVHTAHSPIDLWSHVSK